MTAPHSQPDICDAPEVYVACEYCGGEGHILETIHVYETGCGFSHPDVYSKPCPHCDGTGGMICEAEGSPVSRPNHGDAA